MRLVMPRDVLLATAAMVTLIASAITAGVAVKDFLPISCIRQAYAIIIARLRGLIENDYNIICGITPPANKNDNTFFRVAAINPMEAAGIKIKLMQRRLIAV